MQLMNKLDPHEKKKKNNTSPISMHTQLKFASLIPFILMVVHPLSSTLRKHATVISISVQTLFKDQMKPINKVTKLKLFLLARNWKNSVLAT